MASEHPVPGGLQPSLCSYHPRRTVTCPGATQVVQDKAKWLPEGQNDARQAPDTPPGHTFFLLITVIKGPVSNTLQPGAGLSYLYGSHHPGSLPLSPDPWPGSIHLPSCCPLPTQPIGRACQSCSPRGFDLIYTLSLSRCQRALQVSLPILAVQS